jgi:hypothetical protein
MWRIGEGKVIALTWGGLTGGLKRRMKPAVTTNCEKSAEGIVKLSRVRERVLYDSDTAFRRPRTQE